MASALSQLFLVPTMPGDRPILIALRCSLIYGPMYSRPLGVSLGVNMLPPDRKICNFNCLHCPYGWTPPHALELSEDAWPSTVAG